jgi:hypothetical protein
MALDPITAGLEAGGDILGGIFGIVTSKRQGEAATDVARMQYLAALTQGRTAGQLAEINAENAQKIFLYVMVGLIFFVIVYFITRWAFK